MRWLPPSSATYRTRSRRRDPVADQVWLAAVQTWLSPSYSSSSLWDDAWLFRSPLRTDVFNEVASGTLGVRFRLYGYFGFLLRYGQSFSVATGSGFGAPQVSGITSLVF